MGEALYDELGSGYASVRRPDPRIAARIEAALGGAQTVVNVGAGTGSYEPPDRRVTAVEPAAEMIGQRPRDAAPAVQASAEQLPFEDDSFDAAMAVLTAHHWHDLDTGLREMRRVARQRVVMVTFDPEPLRSLWFVRDYFPAIVGLHADRISSAGLAARLPAASCEPVPVPRDCTDLFFAALWARPEMVFDPEVVRPMWVWNRLPEPLRRQGAERLAADLESGAWERRNGHLLELEELDVGLRLVVSELGAQAGSAAARMPPMEALTTSLEGEIVVLEPLTAENAEELWEPARDPRTWAWLAHLNVRERFDEWVEQALEAAEARTEGPFLIRARSSGQAIGSSRYLSVRPEDRVLEIGWSWLAPTAWGSGANVEAKLLMLGRAFETLDCVRVEFKTDARNERSRAALAAIPAQFEGIMRNHKFTPDVGQRDSAYYSVIDSEWPAVRENLRRRLERSA